MNLSIYRVFSEGGEESGTEIAISCNTHKDKGVRLNYITSGSASIFPLLNVLILYTAIL